MRKRRSCSLLCIGTPLALALAASFAPGSSAAGGKPVAIIGTPAASDQAKSSGKSPSPLVTFLYRVAAPQAWRVESHPWLAPSDYDRYAAVVLTGALAPGRDGAGRWTAEALAGPVEAYVRKGGLIAVEGPALAVLAGGQTLSPGLARLLGFRSVARAPSERVRVRGLSTPVSWDAPGAQSATQLAGARPFGTWADRAGRELGAAATVHDLGAGKVFFAGVTLAALYESAARTGGGVADAEGEWHGTAQEQGADACREMWVNLVNAVGPALDPARRATTWGTRPLGKPAPGGPRQAPPWTLPDDYARLSSILERKDTRVPVGTNPVMLVRDGAARAAIVLRAGANSTERSFAKMLATHIREMSGAELPVLAPSELGGLTITAQGARAGDPRRREAAFVLLGSHAGLEALRVDPAALGREGMVVRTVGNVVVVCGKDWDGLRHATVELLERLGCRYLWPGALGHVVPRRRTVVVPPTAVAEAPRLIMRNIRMWTGWDDKDGFMTKLGLDEKAVTDAKNKASVSAPFARASKKDKTAGWEVWQRLGGRKIHRTHAFGKYWKRYGKEHPDWFALQPDGSRDQSSAKGGTRPRLCLSNEGLIRHAGRERGEWLERHAKYADGSVSLSLNDGSGCTFCLCEACRRLDSPHGEPIRLYNPGKRVRIPYVSLTDRVLTFSNRIIEELARHDPDVIGGVYAYSLYKHPPIHVRPHPNLSIWYVGQGARALHHWNGWLKYTDRLFYRPNFRGGEYGYPANFARLTLADTKYLYNKKLAGTDYDGAGMHWAQRGFTLYVLARAQWNPNRLAYDELLDDYCTTGFGPAAGPVREYFTLLEPLTTRKPHAEKWTAADFAELGRRLDAARVLARRADDPKVSRRVAFLRRGLDIGRKLWRYQRDGSSANAAALKQAIVSAVLEEPFAVYAGQMTRTLRWPNKLVKRQVNRSGS